ncbi:bifunctional diguanylate cyclase/phosphodiesterase [Planococcus sp. CAU13]|uniref:bifunctional diguanylate cyclase/phosphodiesterase n=1 Tax=Planococcus sp. CAU13 TaxID=1541197 RepID=UPI00052FE841|nr:EAL domain-containing protein [Planococcus sp. CAU13]
MPNNKMETEKYIIVDWLSRLGVEFQTGFVVINSEIEDQPILYANQAFYDMTGYSENDVIGRNGRFLHGEKTDRLVSAKIRESAVSDRAETFEIVNYRKDKNPFWNEITVQPIRMDGGEHKYTLLLMKNINDRKREEALIQLQQEAYTGIEKGYMLGSLLENVCRIIESFFKDGTACSILFVDDDNKFRNVAGKSVPKGFRDSIEGREAGPSSGSCGAAYNGGQTVIIENMLEDELGADYREVAIEYGFKSSWSVPFLDKDGNAIGTMGIYFPSITKPDDKDYNFLERIAPTISLTVKYSRQQEEMLKLAYTDRTTGLRNRNYFMIELASLLSENKEGMVAFLSVDEYVNVVDQYGHRAGDQLIQEIGKRFSMATSSRDALIARFSDSTLALVSLMPLDQIPDYLEELAKLLAEPITVRDMELFLSLKTGVSIITAMQQDVEELIRYADSALSKAKLRPGDSICYYENEHDEHMMRNLRIANELTAALRRKEIKVHLQPKVDMRNGRIIGFEALARWHSPELGNIAPDVFIPAAEKNGKIRLLEQDVLKQVLEWLKRRQEQKLPLQQIAINISADHFFHHSFVPNLVDMTAEYGIDPGLIQLEITERIGFVDIEAARKIFRQVTKYGFTSSVDDFGTGYSSLSYLQKLPVSEVKIDRSFISKMHEADTLAIVRTIIQLAENLGLSSVAEGVETEEQKQQLLKLGCHIAQGYYFYRPMPMEDANIL